MHRLHALVLLAWALVRTLFMRAMKKPTGLPVFRSNYAEDKLPPTTVEERALLKRASGCIACGLCEFGAYAGGASPMDLALSSSRQSADADAAVHALAHLSDNTLAAREGICPAKVPLVALAQLTRQRDRANKEMLNI